MEILLLLFLARIVSGQDFGEKWLVLAIMYLDSAKCRTYFSPANEELPQSFARLQPSDSLSLYRPMEERTFEVGERAELLCEIVGDPKPLYRWYRDNGQQVCANDRVKIRDVLFGNKLVLRSVEMRDAGSYQCIGFNRLNITATNSTLTIIPAKSRPSKSPPRSRPNDDNPEDDVPSGGLPDYDYVDMYADVGESEKQPVGKCELYTGQACSQYIGNKTVYIQDRTMGYHERLLADLLMKIKNFDQSEVSQKCLTVGIPLLCHHSFPFCHQSVSPEGTTLSRPVPVCKSDCTDVVRNVCAREFVMAKNMIGKSITLPDCKSISDSEDTCIRISGLHPELQPDSQMTCYNGSGVDYRGTHMSTKRGYTCQMWPWPSFQMHRYCRNPGGSKKAPWCYVNENQQWDFCDIPLCPEKDGAELLLILIPALCAVVAAVIIFAVYCFCRSGSRANLFNKSNKLRYTNKLLLPHNGHATAAVGNGLMPGVANGDLTGSKLLGIREISRANLRPLQELGENAFGKVYQAELVEYYDSSMISTLVALKTLKTGATTQAQIELRKEAELMAKLKHPNIACLLGTSCRDGPLCLVYEYLNKGDLHQYLVTRSPLNELPETDKPPTPIDYADRLHICTQIAAGLDYLTAHKFVHRDLATRNCVLGDHMSVKISDLGIGRSVYATDYSHVRDNVCLPIRWMSPESLFYGTTTVESVVWSFAVLVWEIFTDGLQPYYGYSNAEVLEMVRMHQLLPNPNTQAQYIPCPPLIYGMMVDCWHEIPTYRPSFSELHSRLETWRAEALLHQRQSNGTSSQRSSSGAPRTHTTGIASSGSQSGNNQIGPCLMGPTPFYEVARPASEMKMSIGTGAPSNHSPSGSSMFGPQHLHNPLSHHLQAPYQTSQHSPLLQQPPHMGYTDAKNYGVIGAHHLQTPQSHVITSPQFFSQEPQRQHYKMSNLVPAPQQQKMMSYTASSKKSSTCPSSSGSSSSGKM